MTNHGKKAYDEHLFDKIHRWKNSYGATIEQALQDFITCGGIRLYIKNLARLCTDVPVRKKPALENKNEFGGSDLIYPYISDVTFIGHQISTFVFENGKTSVRDVTFNTCNDQSFQKLYSFIRYIIELFDAPLESFNISESPSILESPLAKNRSKSKVYEHPGYEILCILSCMAYRMRIPIDFRPVVPQSMFEMRKIQIVLLPSRRVGIFLCAWKRGSLSIFGRDIIQYISRFI